MSQQQGVPSINVVTPGTSDAPNVAAPPSSSTHTRTPSDGNLLTPSSGPYQTQQQEPPSPTLSTSSVRFNTTTDLRGREPGNGMSSLSPNDTKRKGSAGSLSGEETEPDHGANAVPSSSATSVTATDSKAKRKKSKDAKDGDGDDGDDGDDLMAKIRVDPSQDNTDPTPFAFKPTALSNLLDPKTWQGLKELGGAEGICKGLGTNRETGLSAYSLGQSDEKSGDADGPSAAKLEERIRVYGPNSLPTKKSKGLLLLMWMALKDKVLVLLSIAAVISLALGLYQDFGVKHEPEPCILANGEEGLCTPPKVDFVEGVAIIIAIAIVVLVGSLNDWQKERQFRALNEKKEDRSVKVIRNGKEQQINIRDVVVGDIALLEPGEIVPVDGILVAGHNIRCDESGATGESDAIKKVPAEEALEDFEKNGSKAKKDAFIISGAKVLEGVGRYVVIAVGTKSFNGRIMMALSGDTESTPLQLKLNNLAELIAKIGGTCGLILFSSLMIKFFVQLRTRSERSANEKAMNFVQILIISVTLVVVAVPEGLPLAVTLALAFATKRMTYENLLVRVLGSCETMANATVVCTDKTGTLTQNVMSVVAGSVGVHGKFVMNLAENAKRSNAEGKEKRKHADDFSIEQKDLNNILPPQLVKVFNEGIALNSTAFEDKNKETGEIEFVGSKTETALLRFAKDLGWEAYGDVRSKAEVVQMLPFASERKYMAVIAKNGGKYRVYFKGASEILSKLCVDHVVVRNEPGNSNDAVETAAIDELSRENINNTIIFYANQMLRTIALCYRDVDVWPPPGRNIEDVNLAELADRLTLVGIVGIEDPLRPGVTEAVTDCSRAGVTVKMCTGDNVLTARSIASQCGIYTPGGLIMEGPVFRKLHPIEREQVVPRLQVLARSSPEDKKILVETLKNQGQVVGVTGDGTNDGPALKGANVGFAMGIAGTEVAKEASDIILMDDNFSSIVSAIMWGRCVNDSVRKFLQFQISVNITAVLITFISSVASDEEESVLTAVQLLWINIIMDTFAALALATDRASRVLLDRKPDPKTAPLFTLDMGKMIIGQALYQTIIVLTLHFAGPTLFNVNGDTAKQAQLEAMIFNVFVFCQIFNSVNCRRIDNKYNIFEGILKNWYFTAITLFEVLIQVLIIYFGGAAFSVTRINGRDWGISIAFGFLAIPLGAIIRTIPNAPIRRLLIHVHLMQDPESLPSNADADTYNTAIDTVRKNLSTFANIRGGRVRAAGLGRSSRSTNAQLEKAGVQLKGLLTMVPTLVATSVGAGWSQQAGIHDPANDDPSKSSAMLWEGKVLLHPETSPDDPAYKIWGRQLEKTPQGPED